MSKLILIGKNRFYSRFLQDADMFEQFKFVGTLMQLTCEITLPIDQVLKNMRAKTADDEKFEVVGLIEPDKEAVILEGHKVISDGQNWRLVDDLCEEFGVKNPTVCKE